MPASSGDTTVARLARAKAARLPDAGPSRPKGKIDTCVIAELDDGDTLTCTSGLRVRFIGIDTPELQQAPFGAASTDGLAAMLPRGATVNLERDIVLTDRYQRRLAYVWYRGQMVNWQMVRQGWAVSYPYGRTQRYTQLRYAAEANSRVENRGLWRLNAFGCRPADFRHRKC